VADSSVIREFLVALGFKADEPGLRKFNAAINETTSSVFKAGATMAVVAEAMAYGTQKIAGSMAELYFAAQRSGSTVTSLQAIGFAMEQVGIDGTKIQGAIEALNINLRSSPGLRQFAEVLLGVNANARDTEKTFIQLMDGLVKLPDFLKRSVGAEFGIDMKTILTWEQNRGKILEEEAKRRAMNKAAGVDPDKTAGALTAAWQKVGEIEAKLGVLAIKTAGVLIVPFNKFMVTLDEAIDKFTKFNKEQEGIPGVLAGAGLTAGAAGLSWMALKKLFGSRAAAAVGASTLETSAAELAALGTGAAGAGVGVSLLAAAAGIGLPLLALYGLNQLLGAPPPGTSSSSSPGGVSVKQENHFNITADDPQAAGDAVNYRLGSSMKALREHAAALQRNSQHPATATPGRKEGG
jgi:hypothetical protein